MSLENISKDIQEDLKDLTEDDKILYIEKLKANLNKLTSLSTQPVNQIR